MLHDSSKKFIVNVDDQISNGCWTNVKSTQSAVELELKRSNRLADKDEIIDVFLADNLWITGLGYKVNNTCIVHLNVEIFHTVYSPFIYGSSPEDLSIKRRVWNGFSAKHQLGASLLSGGSDTMATRIKERAIEYIQEFLVKTSTKAKSEIEIEIRKKSLKEYPDDVNKFINDMD